MTRRLPAPALLLLLLLVTAVACITAASGAAAAASAPPLLWPRWSHDDQNSNLSPLSSIATTGPYCASNNTVAADGASLCAFDASSGAHVWCTATDATVATAPAVDSDGAVWIGTAASTLLRLTDDPSKSSPDIQRGPVVENMLPYGSPILTANLVLMQGWGGLRLFARNSSIALLGETYPLLTTADGAALCGSTAATGGSAPLSSALDAAAGLVYYPCGGRAYVLDAVTGQLERSVNLPRPHVIASDLVLYDNGAYVLLVTQNGTLLALQTPDLQVAGQFASGDVAGQWSSQFAPVVFKQTVVFGCSSIHGVTVTAGTAGKLQFAKAWPSHALENPPALTQALTVSKDGVVYIPTASAIEALDATSGAIKYPLTRLAAADAGPAAVIIADNVTLWSGANRLTNGIWEVQKGVSKPNAVTGTACTATSCGNASQGYCNYCTGKCSCLGPVWAGDSCTSPTGCAGHGSWDSSKGACSCDAGWAGQHCTELYVPSSTITWITLSVLATLVIVAIITTVAVVLGLDFYRQQKGIVTPSGETDIYDAIN